MTRLGCCAFGRYDNGTHLIIYWRNDRRVSGRNVSAYNVMVQTSIPVLNFFVGQFGGFPQDLCAPGGSKARDAVNVEGSVGTCVPYAFNSHAQRRHTAFEIPAALRRMAAWDVTVTVRGYGSHSPPGRPKEATPCTWWCHRYQRPSRAAAAPSPASVASTPVGKQRPLAQLRRLVQQPVQWVREWRAAAG